MTFTLQRVRHPLEVRLLTVEAVDELTPSMRRITLSGPLGGFASEGPDDHVKLIFPRPGETAVDLPVVEGGGIARTEERPPMRDYTPRHFDPAAGTLVIDFVVHGDGPGASWAAAAAPGVQVGQAGPRGSLVLGGAPDWYLLAGDETSLPSIARRLEALPSGQRVIVRVEVGGPEDELELGTAADLDLVWLHRGERPAGELLVDVVRGLELPPGDGYAWVAAEADAARVLRTHLREERGMPKAQTKSTGYWRRGVSDHHDEPDA